MGKKPNNRTGGDTHRRRGDPVKADLAALTLLHNLSTKLLAADGFRPLLQEIMDAAVAIADAERGTLQLIEGDSLRIVAHHGHQPAFLKYFASAETRASACGEALQCGQRVIVEDVETSPLFAGTPSLRVLRDAGVRAVQSTPLRTRQGELLGILTTQWSAPHVPDQHDLWRIDMLARQGADLIEHKQAEEAMRNANEDLRVRGEQLQTTNALLEEHQNELEEANRNLQEEEQELVRHADDLRESEDRYRALFEAAPDAIVVHRDGRFLAANEAVLRLIGAGAYEELAGHRVLDFFRPEDREQAAERMRQAMAGHRLPMRQAVLRRLDGRDAVVEFHTAPVDVHGERAIQTIIRDITERKRAEMSLLAKDAELQLIADATPVLLTRISRDLRYVFVNRACAEMLGHRPKEMVGKRIVEIIGEDAFETIRPHIERVLQGEQVEYESKIPYRGIAPRFMRVTYIPEKDAQGQVVGWLASIRDITDRKQAGEMLRESEERLRSLAENVPCVLMRFDRQLRVVYLSRQSDRYNPNPVERMIGRTNREMGMPQHLCDLWDAAIERVFNTGTQEEMEFDLAGPSGMRTFALKFAPEFGPDREVQYVLGVSSDITERKRAEEALRESEERLRAFLDNSATCAWLKDEEGRYVFISASKERRFGLRFEDVKGKTDFDIWPHAAEELRRNDRAVLESGRSMEMIERIVTPDGAVSWWLNNKFMFRDAAGRRYVGGLGVDITERKRAEDALRELTATLESKVAERTTELTHRARQLQKLMLELTQAEERERRRMAVILHEDLQQQIAGARFHLNMLRRGAQDDRQRAGVNRVDEMLRDAIEKSRDLSHDLSPAVLHLNDFGESLRWLANQVRTQQGLDVTLDVPENMRLQSEAMATFLFRAAQEMLFNVVKHARVREAAIHVRRIRHWVGLAVSDRGQGFDPRELKETTGIGLFSIRERTELLGGRMQVRSVKGRGSRVSLIVPADPQDANTDGKVTDIRPVSAVMSPPSPNGVLRVLLVDDHDIVREGLAALLRGAPGIELVGGATNGHEAVTMAASLRPDVVIMDVAMPLMSGDEATRRIKARLPGTRVIALSMYDEAGRKEEMSRAGADGYILKTASTEELIAAIRGRTAGA